MGGSMFNSNPIKRDFVESLAYSFMQLAMKKSEYVIAGSYRRGANICGDIEIVIPCDTDEELARINDNITNQFGCTKSLTPNTHGVYGQVQFDLFPCRNYELGSMLLHATGSWQFNRNMRTYAKRRGMLLNQYGLFDRRTSLPIVISNEEVDFFKYLNLDVVNPSERSKV